MLFEGGSVVEDFATGLEVAYEDPRLESFLDFGGRRHV
jgi:hypothetical protein